MPTKLDDLCDRNHTIILKTPFLNNIFRIRQATSSYKSKALPESKFPYLLTTHISKPRLTLHRQPGNAIILTRSSNNIPLGNMARYKFIELI